MLLATCFSRVDNAIKVAAHRSLTQIMQKNENFPPELGMSFILKAVPGLARDVHELSGMCCPDGSALWHPASKETQMRWKEGVLGLEKEDTILEPGFWQAFCNCVILRKLLPSHALTFPPEK